MKNTKILCFDNLALYGIVEIVWTQSHIHICTSGTYTRAHTNFTSLLTRSVKLRIVTHVYMYVRMSTGDRVSHAKLIH